MRAMTEERRSAQRHTLWIPVQVKVGADVEMLAVSRNISWNGVLVIVGASAEVGERVRLTLQVPGEDDHEIGGEIVRSEVNEDDPEGLWRHLLAIRFDEELPGLESAFERLESKR